jgi:hypothetical protein
MVSTSKDGVEWVGVQSNTTDGLDTFLCGIKYRRLMKAGQNLEPFLAKTTDGRFDPTAKLTWST